MLLPFLVAAHARPTQMARWNEDGSCAATARVRSGKGEPFTLPLSKAEIDEDLSVLSRIPQGR